MLNDEKNPIEFKKDEWTKRIENIEVFDIFYVESNVYIINLGNYDTPGKLFGVIVGDKAITAYKDFKGLKQKRQRYANLRRSLKNWVKKLKDENRKDEYRSKISKIGDTISQMDIKIKETENRLTNETELFGKQYLNKINEYLDIISPELRITKLNKKGQMFVYYITINNYEVRTDKESKSLSRTLSEGEKNSLAFAFFMASIELKLNLDKKLIVFDDPISSLDYGRRSVTLSLLSNLAHRSNQFVLLSHDIHFVKDFTQRNNDVLNLKIINAGKTGIFVRQDIEDETLTGVFKDLRVLNDFIQKGETSEYGMRDVVRCIRPVLEGFFRIKFYKHIKKNDWLGDMIGYIRDSKEGDSFFREKENLDALCDINDYSKVYHHSNPNYLEIPLNAAELKMYCKRTIDLLEKL